MSIPAVVITAILVIALLFVLLFVFTRIIKGCLLKMITGLVILGALAYLAYWYFTR